MAKIGAYTYININRHNSQMGGNALSKPADSLSIEEFNLLSSYVLSRLLAFFPELQAKVPAQLSFKTVFRDIDIIMHSGVSVDRMRGFLGSLGASDVTFHGKVGDENGVSFGINYEQKLVQVDLIYVDPCAFDFSVEFYGFGDMSAFLSTLFRTAGLLLNVNGLFYVVPEVESDPARKHQATSKIPLSVTWDSCISALGLDPATYHKGFSSYSDMFEYIAESPFFIKSNFIYKLSSKQGQLYCAKRPAYAAFWKWLTALPDQPFKRIIKVNAADLDPLFESKLTAIIAARKNHEVIRKKFNGNLVREITGLTGKSLGTFILDYSSSKIDFNSEILEMSEEVVKLDIKAFLNTWKPAS